MSPCVDNLRRGAKIPLEWRLRQFLGLEVEFDGFFLFAAVWVTFFEFAALPGMTRT
jgi:hypothetical protein